MPFQQYHFELTGPDNQWPYPDAYLSSRLWSPCQDRPSHIEAYSPYPTESNSCKTASLNRHILSRTEHSSTPVFSEEESSSDSSLSLIGETSCNPTVNRLGVHARSSYDSHILSKFSSKTLLASPTCLPKMIVQDEFPTTNSPSGSDNQGNRRPMTLCISSNYHPNYETSPSRRLASLPKVVPCSPVVRTDSPQVPGLAPLRITQTCRPILPWILGTPPCTSPCPPTEAESLEGHVPGSPSGTETLPPSMDPSENYIKEVASAQGSWSCLWRSKEFPYEICGYRARRHLVKRHINCVHLKIRPLVCKYCNRTFSQKTNFETHVNTHTGAKPHGCPECPERFSDPSGRHRHRKQVHGYKPRMRKKVFPVVQEISPWL